MPATKTKWDGRLGIDVVGKMQGCCIDAILKWRPSLVGQKSTCPYCNTMMKTIRAGEVLSSSFNGGINEHKRMVEEPEIVVGSLFFSNKKFASVEAIKTWMEEREVQGDVEELDDHARCVQLERILPESARAVWVAPGVVGEIGVAEKTGPAQGGQASMSPPAITTTSMAGGGTTNPTQGPAAVVNANAPIVMHGLTEMSDGHQHEFYLTPAESENGFRVKGFSSFVNGHAHMIEAAVGDDGSLDTRTAPDQAPVGGHAHAHRVIFNPATMSPMKDLSSVPLVEKEYRVTSGDVVLLHRAAGLVKSFVENILNGRSVVISTEGFKEQMNAAIERARGQAASVDGMVTLRPDDLRKLAKSADYIEEFGSSIASEIGMTK